MFVATVIVGLVLGGMLAALGVSKLSGSMDVMRDELDLSPQLWQLDGAASFLGGGGVVIGLFDRLSALGSAAGIGVVLLTTLAAGFHLRRNDGPQQLVPAVLSLLLAVPYVVLRAASA